MFFVIYALVLCGAIPFLRHLARKDEFGWIIVVVVFGVPIVAAVVFVIAFVIGLAFSDGL